MNKKNNCKLLFINTIIHFLYIFYTFLYIHISPRPLIIISFDKFIYNSVGDN